MNTITRRSLGILAGLTLGWYAAGLTPGLNPSMAQHDTHHDAAPTHDDHAGHDHDAHQPAPAHADTTHDANHHEPIESASLLVPGPGQVDWYRPVLGIIAGLFVAAIVLGIPALKLRGPEPPDPATAPAHDSHAH